MKPSRTLTLAVGFVGGLLIGATSQAIRLALAEKQPENPEPETLPKFLTDTDPPTSGSPQVG